ncbi:substrate-binding periplasmic protein [Shewanella sp. 125m-7]
MFGNNLRCLALLSVAFTVQVHSAAESSDKISSGQLQPKVLSINASQSDKPLRMQVLTYEEPPFAFIEQGQHKGLLVELVAELFKRAALDYQLSFVPLKRALLTTLQHKNYCVTPVERSQEREADYQWISPMLISRYGLYSSDSQKIALTSLSDAKPFTIGSYLGSGIAEYLLGLGYNVELASLRRQNIKKLQYNRIDLMASELMSAREDMRVTNIELGEPELVFYTSIRAMACNIDLAPKVKNHLDAALLAMYQDGFIDALYLRYGVSISL